ncbi:hypothetical protein FGB62_149g04 [Gracilaria domingensis]|nr:hypothetical protein FGB62_149g04 [Gracilaria domingensis]
MSLPSNPAFAADIPSAAFREKEKSRKDDDAPSPSSTIVVESVSVAKARPTTSLLDSLPSDVIARIIHYALEHSERGVPYYPPIKAPSLVPLALTNQATRRIIAPQCDSDLGYIDAIHGANEQNEERLAAKKDLVQFYRAQNGHLKKFNLHKRSTISHLFRLYATEIVLSTKPHLTEMDVSDIPKDGKYFARTLQTVVGLIQLSSSSLQNLKMSFHNTKFVEMIISLSLPNLSELNVRLPHCVPTSMLTRFFSKHGSMLETLTMSAVSEIPDDAVANIVAHTPRIRHLNFNGGMDPAISYSFLALIRSYSHLQSVSVHNYGLCEDLRQAFETHPNQPKIYVRRSIFNDLPELISDVPSFSKTLTRAETVICETDRDIMALMRLQNLEELHIRVMPPMVPGFRTALSSLRKLRSMTINCENLGGPEVSRGIVDEHLVQALQQGKSLKQLVIAYPPLSVPSLQRIMKSYGARLEYFVAGIHSPGRSRMRCIIDMVNWVMCHNPNMKVLCFGLGLCFDSRAHSLYDELMHTLERAEQKLPMLNTHWLRLNGKSLLTFPPPGDEMKEGFVEEGDNDNVDASSSDNSEEDSEAEVSDVG